RHPIGFASHQCTKDQLLRSAELWLIRVHFISSLDARRVTRFPWRDRPAHRPRPLGSRSRRGAGTKRRLSPDGPPHLRASCPAAPPPREEQVRNEEGQR